MGLVGTAATHLLIGVKIKKQDEGLTNSKRQNEISTERFKNSSNNLKKKSSGA